MGFSVTGSTFQHDIALRGIAQNKEPVFEVSLLNRTGYKPLISVLSGSIRTLLALVHMVVHLVAIFFDFKHASFHMLQIGIGALNVLRGLTEVIPLFGNVIIFVIDFYRTKKTLESLNQKEGKLPWNNRALASSLWNSERLANSKDIRFITPIYI